MASGKLQGCYKYISVWFHFCQFRNQPQWKLCCSGPQPGTTLWVFIAFKVMQSVDASNQFLLKLCSRRCQRCNRCPLIPFNIFEYLFLRCPCLLFLTDLGTMRFRGLILAIRPALPGQQWLGVYAYPTVGQHGRIGKDLLLHQHETQLSCLLYGQMLRYNLYPRASLHGQAEAGLGQNLQPCLGYPSLYQFIWKHFYSKPLAHESWSHVLLLQNLT